MIGIVNFGSQYTTLIARLVRKYQVYSEIIPYDVVKDLSNAGLDKYKGIILSGSHQGVSGIEDYIYGNWKSFIRNTNIPVLGICFGAQLIANTYNCEVIENSNMEFGQSYVIENNKNILTTSVWNNTLEVWMSHADSIINSDNAQKFLDVFYTTKNNTCAGFQVKNKKIFGLQFHPEVEHTREGKYMIHSFLFNICNEKISWVYNDFINETINDIKKQVGDEKVLMAVSGGVDSTTAAELIHKAIGDNLYPIFVNNGLLRKDEEKYVIDSYKHFKNFTYVDAADEFLYVLKNHDDPEHKRKLIGTTFINVFMNKVEEIRNQVKITWLGQGTIYPDVIESGIGGAKIKSHHNVGGLPDVLNLKLIEPLRKLFKDEVRIIAKEININDNVINRHPFPGPGLAIRIMGEVTPLYINILQRADDIYINMLKKKKLYECIWQAGAILLPIKTIGVMGDNRTSKLTIALRAVTSVDGMTADIYDFKTNDLKEISTEIINNVPQVNRVVYDITTKPPATIEWE